MIEPKSILKNIVRMGENSAERIGQVMRLDRNERTTALPKDLVDKIFKTISPEELVAYPDLEPLYQSLSKHLGVPRDCLLLTSGSDTGIKALFEVYVQPGDEIVMLRPTYGMFFVYPDMYGAKKVPVDYQEDFSLKISNIIEKINDPTKLVLLANPNHTATIIDEKDLCRIIEHSAKHNALVLVDEAYHYFYPGTMVPFIQKYDNLIVLRSFSKAFGIAPLRVGVLISQKENIANLHKVKLTHEITSVGAAFAQYLIEHPETLNQHVQDVNEGKKVIQEQCRRLGLEMIPSQANFVFIRLPKELDGGLIVERLKQDKIHIKGPFKGVPIDKMIRITVGPADQMKIVMNKMEQILSDLKAIKS